MKNEILAIKKGIKKILIFLTPKLFLIKTDCKGILSFIKRIYLMYKHKENSRISNYGLTSLPFLLNIFRDQKIHWPTLNQRICK